MELFGVRMVGMTEENAQKLLLTIIFLSTIFLLQCLGLWLTRGATSRLDNVRARFWTRQAVHLIAAALMVISLLSIWFDDPVRLATGLGLVTAGLAFALQKVVTSFAGYIVILRGKTFNVGERITMGGVRGDVISLGFIQTSILEMGQPPSVQGADPAMWVRGRQFTGRIVTVTNDKVFEEPVYNYTRDFPFIWEEMVVPIRYGADHALAERIVLECADSITEKFQDQSAEVRDGLEKKYGIRVDDTKTRVFYRLTDNWIELTVRFIVQEHGVRDVKDAMSRKILGQFEQQGLDIASATYDIVRLPKLELSLDSSGERQASA